MKETTETREPLRIRARNFGADLLTALLCRWYWVVSVTLVAFAAAWYYLSIAPPVYQALATVQVKISTPGVVISKDAGPQGSDLDLRNMDAINTIVGKFKMLSLYEAMLVENPSLLRDPELVPMRLSWTAPWPRSKELPPVAPVVSSARPTAAENGTSSDPDMTDAVALARNAALLAPQVFGCFNVTNRRQTRLVDIAVSHSSPRMAKLLADAVVTTYEKVYVDRRLDRTETNLKTLTKVSEGARQELQKAQNALAAYRTALALNAKLQEQETSLSALLLRYRKKHPDVIESRRLLKETQEDFLREFTAARESGADQAYWKSLEETAAGGPGAQRGSATGPISHSSDELGEDARMTKEDNNRVEAVREAVRQLQARSKVLESEIESQNRVFDTVLTQMQGATLSSSGENQEAEVIPLEAAREGNLIGPRRLPIMGAAGFGGLVLGVGLALLLNRLDNRIHTVSDLETATAIPVLASVAALRPEALVQSARTGEEATAMNAWAPDLFFRDNGARTVEAEMIRVLRTSIILLGPQEAVKTILFTSALPGEGKSFTSANVAAAFAMQGARTLLVDMDLRRPRLHALFGTDRHKGAGLVDLLAGQCALPSTIHPTGLANLFLLPAGSVAPNPAELLNVENCRQLFAALKSGFDRIIIDTAPLLPVSDTRLISQAVDTCILVAGAEKTPKGAIIRALELLGTAAGADGRTNMGGCVLNGTVESRRNLAGNYSYGYYGRYGGKYSSYGTVYGEEEGREKDKARGNKE
jgi:succinoglycan biosynthesis transport protein ExoP